MTQRTVFLPEHEDVIKELTELATIDRENFRLNATKAYQNYSPKDRLTINRLETDDTSAYTLLTQWQSSLRPLLDELTINSTKAAFSKDIAKYLLLNLQIASRKVDELVSSRRLQTLEDFLYQLYPLPTDQGKDKLAKSRSYARNLLSQPDTEIEDLKNKHIAFLLHHTVAIAESIAVADVHASWPRRRRTIKYVIAERKKTATSERHRLRSIEERLEQLKTTHNDTLGELLERDWDLIVVISLRNQYEKRIASLSADERKSPLKRLVIFEEVTKEFRDEQVNRLAQNDPAQNSLAAARRFAETTDALLLRVFDLTNEQKNQLLVFTKEARKLEKERDAIIEGRAHRQQVLQNSLV